jgi:hypothetical protein
VTKLLDLNILIALFDTRHPFHDAAHNWFAAQQGVRFATCPQTENGFLRILSQPLYPSGTRSIRELESVLRAFIETLGDRHEFWPDDVSLLDRSLVDTVGISSPGKITDAYLLALTKKRGGKMVTLDRRMPFRAIVGGSEDLLEVIPV